MTSHVTAARLLHDASRRSLFSRSLSVIGTVAVLSGGTVLAQSADTLSDAAPEQQTPSSALEVPSLNAPSVDLPIAPAAPEAFPTRETPLDLDRAIAPSSSGAASGVNDQYIDSTSYNIGATERSSAIAKRTQLLPVTSSMSVGSSAASDYSVTPGRTTPSVRDYYYRTLRPPAMLGNGNIRLVFPLSIPAPITSVFGWRLHPVSGEQRFHAGTDLGAPMGTPVLAAYAGKVALADFLGGYGLAVAIDHNQGTQQTLYGHLSEIFVKPGEVVKQGMVIGRVGSTGVSTGPHLHFEFRQLTTEGWVTMDPGAQLEYALAQFVKSFDFAQAKPGEVLGLGGSLGAVNVGAKGDITVQTEELKKLSREVAVKGQG
ncbi:MAG: M23 family metallopeptidase [Stenomitos frigidus ULC029]